MERFFYYWLAQGVMVAVCFVQLTVSDIHPRTTCDFYPTHGVIQKWYYESSFHQPTNNSHGTNIFGRRSFSHVRPCQYTGSYKNYGGKHLILVFCPDSPVPGRILVDITSGHCAPHDCCHCKSNPCMQGSCSNNATGYTCTCDAEYTGNDCDIHVLIDRCANDPCVHGICSNGKCVCYIGYIGTTCSQLIQTTTERSTQASLASTHRSTKVLLTTTHRSTLAVLTTSEGSTNGIITSPAKICMDDQFFNCQNPDICKSQFRDNCPLSCEICVPDPIKTKPSCVDNIFLNCQDPSICSLKLNQYCPVTCGHCASTTSDRTTQSTERGTVQHTCNKIGLLMDLAMGQSLHQQSAKGCGGNSSDAVVIKHCQAPSFAKWRKGFEVIRNCHHINHYTPVAEWNNLGFTDNIGVMIFCHNGVIEMISQTCGGQIVMRNVTTPASNSFYTVDWA
ncbi:neurogenic locus notch homolog protein 1-like [Mytilus trossulus]|uniref:neurogenic locus notch homolog protein 1-like n=1 Tax=Mytilus trossulus TaxID=6551 RepID=UPI003003E0E4